MLAIKYIDINELRPWDKNPKLHNKEAIKQSVRDFDITQPILVQKGTNRIITGHGRLEAFKELEFKEVPIIELEMDDNKANAYALIDNQTTMLAGWDFDLLNEEIQRLEIDAPEIDLSAYDFAGFGPHDFDADLLHIDEKEGEYDHFPIFSKDEVLESVFQYLRRTGIPYDKIEEHEIFQAVNHLNNNNDATLLRTNTGSKIANCFHPHRYNITTQDHVSYKETFENDDQLKRAINLVLDDNVRIGLNFAWLNVIGHHRLPSNFRPGYACYLYKKYVKPGGTVLDTSMGYGGRMVGARASGVVNHYIGIDPATETFNGDIELSKALKWEDHVTLINLPAEDVDSFNESCDFHFTSPPYFNREHYSDEDTQSFNRYKTLTNWVEGFLFPCMELQYSSLKSGCYSVMNIEDIKEKGKVIPLTDHCVEQGERAGFIYEGEEERYMLPQSFGGNKDKDYERVFIFKKP